MRLVNEHDRGSTGSTEIQKAPEAQKAPEIQEEPLYDILIPPGVPRKIILEIPKKFDVTVVERKAETQVCKHGRR